MTNSEFLTLAEQIGQLLKAYDKMIEHRVATEGVDLEYSTALWERTKFHIKQKLDTLQMTPEQFDAKMKQLAGDRTSAARRRITKLAKMTFNS